MVAPTPAIVFYTMTISASYGYCVLVVCISWLIQTWLGINVVRARQAYDVQNPRVYGDHMFNCIQRAYQNSIENYSSFVVLLLLGGLQYPKMSAFGGMLWVISRIFYARGYYSGDPSKRLKGVFGYIGMFIMFMCTFIFGLSLLQWV